MPRFDSDPRLQPKPFIYRGFIGVLGKSSTNLALAHYPTRARRGHAHCTDARQIQPPYPYKMKVQDMTQRYRKFKRAWGMWYAFDNATGNSVSLKTRGKVEAERKGQAMNETERQPAISLGLARVYLNATDPKLATRTCLHARTKSQEHSTPPGIRGCPRHRAPESISPALEIQPTSLRAAQLLALSAQSPPPGTAPYSGGRRRGARGSCRFDQRLGSRRKPPLPPNLHEDSGVSWPGATASIAAGRTDVSPLASRLRESFQNLIAFSAGLRQNFLHVGQGLFCCRQWN